MNNNQRPTRKAVWVKIEEWYSPSGRKLDLDFGDVEVFSSIEEALDAWIDDSNRRAAQVDSTVSPSTNPDDFKGFSLTRWYSYNKQGTTFEVCTKFYRKWISFV